MLRMFVLTCIALKSLDGRVTESFSKRGGIG